MNREQALQAVSRELDIQTEKTDQSLITQLLRNRVNELLNTDFNKLISILYRMDVSESQLRSLLKKHPNTDAAVIVADLMIERQEQKIISRKKFSKKNDDINDEDKW